MVHEASQVLHPAWHQAVVTGFMAAEQSLCSLHTFKDLEEGLLLKEVSRQLEF